MYLMASHHGRLHDAAGFLNELLEATAMQHQPQALPEGLEFAVHVSDRPKLRLDAYPPGLAPLVLGYSKVWRCGGVGLQCPS